MRHRKLWDDINLKRIEIHSFFVAYRDKSPWHRPVAFFCCTDYKSLIICPVVQLGIVNLHLKQNISIMRSSFRLCYRWIPKGQLISKCLFGILNSPKKRTKKFKITTVVPQVELFPFVFWKNWRDQKYISKLTDL